MYSENINEIKNNNNNFLWKIEAKKKDRYDEGDGKRLGCVSWTLGVAEII